MLASQRQAVCGIWLAGVLFRCSTGRWSSNMSNPKLPRLRLGSHQALVGATALAGSVCMHQAKNPAACTLWVCQQRGSILIWSLRDCGHPMPPPALERWFALPPCPATEPLAVPGLNSTCNSKLPWARTARPSRT